MKLLHLGDLHIGKSVCDFNMLEDQKYMLQQVLDLIEKQKADAVLIAGDVYDKSIPSEEAVRLLDWFLCRLSELGTETFMISGNHDSDERLHFGSSLFEAKKIHISAKYRGTVYKRECRDKFGRVNIYLLPFIKASQVRYFYPEEDIRTYEDAVRAVLAHGDVDPAERNILVAHQFVAGQGGDPRLGGSESAATVNVGTVERIGAHCFDVFDYVALGHIHSPQSVGRDTVRYSGSLLKYSLSEVNDTKSVPIVTLGEKGSVSVELAELKPLRDMRHLKGRMEQLLRTGNIVSPEDYIYVTLTDEDPVDNSMDIFRQYYPNTMKIVYDNAHTRESAQADITDITRDKSFPELIADFYRMMYGCDISEEELRMVKEAAGEAGVINEAD
ncbi:MAG: exonuclease SbcCD subunit D [Butyrivibrio sp.]|nr:exonuclease SbcCD subunit D [Acetatifactor muris]MCM1559289.1 exonuclease SbcCD subunit D [Butyrivibrio sp.]